MMDEEIRQVISEVREMKQMCGNINMKLTNIVTQRGQDWKKRLEAEYQRGLSEGNERGLTEGKKAFDLLDAERDSEYQRGLEEGKKQAKVQAHLDVCHDIERVAHGNYQKGLDDAWEAARKIADMWGTMDNDDLLETFGVTAKIGESVIGTLFKKQTANEAMLELEAYEEKQTDDEIKVGDEVKWEGVNFTVLRVFTPKGCYEQCDGFDCDGNGYTNILTKDVTKTNRHFDIASILKEMQS